MGRMVRVSAICLQVVLCFALASAVQVGCGSAKSQSSSHGTHVENHFHWSERTSESTFEGIIPQTLNIPEGSEVQQVLFAVGVQIYSFNGSNWVLTNVSADLFDFKGVKVGHHFLLAKLDVNGGQASWVTFFPPSRVTVKRLAGVKQPDSIDWLLLEATSNSGSSSFFGSIGIVQRLYTHGGLAPNATVPAKEGDVNHSQYTSLYTFASKESAAPYS